ncbi:hypothetical protein lerEdw1_010441 [Lerista edwardsae]|nr:hypothetical protein lerEdw1_010441 [Lerista edwardsae]
MNRTRGLSLVRSRWTKIRVNWSIMAGTSRKMIVSAIQKWSLDWLYIMVTKQAEATSPKYRAVTSRMPTGGWTRETVLAAICCTFGEWGRRSIFAEGRWSALSTRSMTASAVRRTLGGRGCSASEPRDGDSRSMFHLLTYCWSWLQAIQEPVRKVTILVLGLDGAGKSSVVTEIQRVLSCEVLPTTKPNQTELRVDRFEVSLVDLAGGQRPWGTWKSHYSAAHGIIFVIDSSNAAQMEEAKKTLCRVLEHPKVSGKPLLLLANKQDQLDALLPCEVIECLSLERLVNEHKSPCRVEPCSAVKRLPKFQCWTIIQGLHWLLRTIAIHYGALCGPMQEDSPQRKASLQQEAPRKTPRARMRMRGNRAILAGAENSQEGAPKLEENKVPKHPQNIPAQKEDHGVAPQKRKKKVKLKTRKKGSVQSESTLPKGDHSKTAEGGSKNGAIGSLLHSNKVAQENPTIKETSPPQAGEHRCPTKSTKKRNKGLKNKTKVQEPPQTQPKENLSGTFDLYRRAMLALKMQQGRQKLQNAEIP